MQLPYAIVSVSLLSAALPSMAAQSDPTGRARAIELPAHSTITWLVPASLGLALMAPPLAAVVVGAEGRLVAAAITGFAVSLLPFSLFQLLTRASYTWSDTRTPALVNVGVNVVNVAAAAAVVATVSGQNGRVVGLALAHAASYIAGCGLLGLVLWRRGFIDARALVGRIPKVALASAPLAVALVGASDWLRSLDTRAEAIAGVSLATAVGGAAYIATANALRLRLPLGRVGVQVRAPEVVRTAAPSNGRDFDDYDRLS
jgi:putative peptidoglycan lipid II flippase